MELMSLRIFACFLLIGCTTVPAVNPEIGSILVETDSKGGERIPSSGGGLLELPDMGAPIQTTISWLKMPGDETSHFYLRITLKSDVATFIQLHGADDSDSGRKFVEVMKRIVSEGMESKGAEYLVLTVAPEMEAAAELEREEKQSRLKAIGREVTRFFTERY